MIYPGDTQPMSFTLPFRAAYVEKAMVSFFQHGATRLSVEATAVSQLTDNTCSLWLELTQAQSLQLRECCEVDIQVNVIGTDGKRLPSAIIHETCGEQYHRNII